jgi:hypothetical protein
LRRRELSRHGGGMKPQPLVPVFVVLMLVALPAAFVQGVRASGVEAAALGADGGA